MQALILRHVYSGDVAFTAALLVVAIAVADAAGWIRQKNALAPVARVVFLVALALGALSGTPVPLPLLLPLGVSLVVYGLLFLRDLEHRYRRGSAIAVITLVTLAVVFELPHRSPTPPAVQPYSALLVLGDSLASGGFGEQRRWIEILGDRAGLSIIDRAWPAQEVAGAAREVMDLDRRNGTALLLLIGGNDMLAGRGAVEFGAELRRLVHAAVAKGYRPVFLVELPVLPGRWGYIAQQRRIAREYGLVLIPRRVLASVLADPRNTSDGIHLTQRGHDVMAEALLPWLGGAAGYGAESLTQNAKPDPRAARATVGPTDQTPEARHTAPEGLHTVAGGLRKAHTTGTGARKLQAPRRGAIVTRLDRNLTPPAEQAERRGTRSPQVLSYGVQRHRTLMQEADDPNLHAQSLRIATNASAAIAMAAPMPERVGTPAAAWSAARGSPYTDSRGQRPP